MAGGQKPGSSAREARDSASDAPTVERLIALSGDGPHQFSLDRRRIAVGSGRDNDLVLAHPTVSRHHAVIRRRFGRVRVADLESTNGTFINRKRIAGRATLRRGDELRFGAVRFAFHEPGGKRRRRARRALVTACALIAVFAAGFVAAWQWGDELLARFEAPAPKPVVRVAPAAPQPIAAEPRALSSSAAASPAFAATVVARAIAPEAAEPVAAPEETRSSAAGPAWLERLNYYRAMTKLGRVSEDPSFSAKDRQHAEYMARTQAIGHAEDPSSPWFTKDGDEAARRSDVFATTGALVDEEAIDWWIRGPFHRLPMLEPKLARAGFGAFTANGMTAAAVYLDLPPADLLSNPVEFPPAGSSVGLIAGPEDEWPDPIKGCPGYTQPVGLPITIQFGWNATPRVSEHSLLHGDLPLEHCFFDAASYSSSDAAEQQWARKALSGFGAIVMVPRKPLRRSQTYRVSVTVNGKPYKWSFSVAP